MGNSHCSSGFGSEDDEALAMFGTQKCSPGLNKYQYGHTRNNSERGSNVSSATSSDGEISADGSSSDDDLYGSFVSVYDEKPDDVSLLNLSFVEEFAQGKRKRGKKEKEEAEGKGEEEDSEEGERRHKKQRLRKELGITDKEQARLNATELRIRARFQDLQDFELGGPAVARLLGAWRLFSETLTRFDEIVTLLESVDVEDLIVLMVAEGQISEEMRHEAEDAFQVRLRMLPKPVDGITLEKFVKIRAALSVFYIEDENGTIVVPESGDDIGRPDDETSRTLEPFRMFHFDIGLALLEIVDARDLGNFEALRQSRHRPHGPGVAVITNVMQNSMVREELYNSIEQVGLAFFSTHPSFEQVQDKNAGDLLADGFTLVPISPTQRLRNLTLLYNPTSLVEGGRTEAMSGKDEEVVGNPLIDEPELGVWQRPLPVSFPEMQGLDRSLPHMLYTESQVLATVVVPLLSEPSLRPVAEALLAIASKPDSDEMQTDSGQTQPVALSNGNVKVSHRWIQRFDPLVVDTVVPLREQLQKELSATAPSVTSITMQTDSPLPPDVHTWTARSRTGITYERNNGVVEKKIIRQRTRPNALSNVALVLKKPLAVVPGSQIFARRVRVASREVLSVLMESYMYAVPENAIVVHGPDVWRFEPQQHETTVRMRSFGRRFSGVVISNLFPLLLDKGETAVRLTWQFYSPQNMEQHRQRMQLALEYALVEDQHILWEGIGRPKYIVSQELRERINEIRNRMQTEKAKQIFGLSAVQKRLLGLDGETPQDELRSVEGGEALVAAFLTQCRI